MCNLPLFIIKTTAASLDQFYQPDTQISNNITLYTLNTDMFQNPQWHYEGTNGYIPKHTPLTEGTKPVYLYGTANGNSNSNNTYVGKVPLWNTIRMTAGTAINSDTTTPDQSTWGNPFHPNYIHPDATLWYSFDKPRPNITTKSLSRFYYIWEPVRYNPLKDTGEGNKVYFKSTKLNQGTFNDVPTNKDIVIEEYPLWLIFWAFSDWIAKAKPIQHVASDYQIVVKTKFFLPTKTNICISRQIPMGCKLTLKHRIHRNRQSKLASKIWIPNRSRKHNCRNRPSSTKTKPHKKHRSSMQI